VRLRIQVIEIYGCCHRYRSKLIFGGAKDFCPNFPRFAKKNFDWTPFFQIETRWAPFFSNQSRLGSFFAHIFRDFAQISSDFAKVFTDFVRISTDFARIFTKSELLGVRLHPLHPRLLHHWFLLMIGSAIVFRWIARFCEDFLRNDFGQFTSLRKRCACDWSVVRSELQSINICSKLSPANA